MNKDIKSNKKVANFKSRKQGIVTCPHCWTHQRTERNFCYRCGAEFVYDYHVAVQASKGLYKTESQG